MSVAPDSPNPMERFEPRRGRAEIIEGIWVPTVGQNRVLTAVKDLMLSPTSTRPTNLALMAAPNFGKSQLLNYFRDQTNPPFDETAISTPVPVIRVDLTNLREPSAILRDCLSTLSVRFHLKDPIDELWRRLKVHIPLLDIKIFLLDDANSIATHSVSKQREFLQVFRAFGNKTGRPIVMAGTEDLQAVLDHDYQFKTRFVTMALPPIASDLETQRIVKGFEERWRPGRSTHLVTPQIVKEIVRLVGREPGALFRLLKRVATQADEQGHELISIEQLRAAAARVPGLPGADT